jgi:hypothetical protein
LRYERREPKRTEKLNLFEQGFDFVPYRELPVAYQMAMAWYMAVNGEAWDDVVDHDAIKFPKGVKTSDHPLWHQTYKRVVAEHLPQFIEQYGDVEFGVATWPVDDVIRSISGDETFKEDGVDFEGTKSWFEQPMENYHATSYPIEDRWPVIMSPFEEETFQDGWHRFHIYVASGHPDIPVIFFPEEWHREMKAEMDAGAPKI